MRGAITRCWAVAAGTGDVLMARLREGRAHTARGAAHFLRETVGRVRYCGARGQLTVLGRQRLLYPRRGRRLPPDGCPLLHRHPPARPPAESPSRRYPMMPWTPIPYWMDGAADVAETTYTPFQAEADAAPVRLIVRRVKPTPGSQLALFARYSYHAFITDRDGERPWELEADHRRHAEIENAIRDLKYGVGAEPSPLGPLRRQRRLAGGTGDGAQPGPLDGADWSGRADRNHQDPQAAGLRSGGTGSPARHAASLCIFPGAGPGRSSSAAPWPDCEPFHSQPDGARPPLTRQPTQRPRKLAPAQSASASCRVLSRHLARHSHCRPPSVPPKAPTDRPPTSRLPKFEPGSSRL